MLKKYLVSLVKCILLTFIQVYFWIGDECSVDEQAVAAIKVKEANLSFFFWLSKYFLNKVCGDSALSSKIRLV